jgi:hypothetical protein
LAGWLGNCRRAGSWLNDRRRGRGELVEPVVALTGREGAAGDAHEPVTPEAVAGLLLALVLAGLGLDRDAIDAAHRRDVRTRGEPPVAQ